MNSLDIVTYHYVRDLAGSRFPKIKGRTIDEFKWQLKYIAANYSLISMDYFIGVLNDQRVLPQRAAMLTFDDGYRDHHDNVFPLLKEQGIPGTFFVAGQPLVEGKALDVNKIHYILAATDIDQVLMVLFGCLREFRSDHNLRADEDYWREFARAGRFDGADVKFVKNMLQGGLDQPVLGLVLEKMFSELVGLTENEFVTELYMTTAEIKEMAEAGMCIGNHGYCHVRLSALGEIDQQTEIERSLSTLRTLGLLGEDWTMCYPYGDFNDATETVLTRTGCKAAFTTVGETTNLMTQGKYSLKRLDTNQVHVAKKRSRE